MRKIYVKIETKFKCKSSARVKIVVKKAWIVKKDHLCKRKVQNINLQRTLNMGKKLYKANKKVGQNLLE